MDLVTIARWLKWIVQWIDDRRKEPSTIISIGFALAYFHVPVTQTALQMGVDGFRDILVGISMLLGVVLSEKGVTAISPSSVLLDRTLVTAN